MTDPKILERMVKEAFQRSQKDIHLAHIFISLKNAGGIVDTVAAIKKRDEVLQQLKRGTDFLQVAQLNSDDPAVKTNKGDIGYITVFTLPYEFENIVYATPSGKYSEAVRSKIGFHIFKNLGERKAVGKIKTQQILLAIPPGADEMTKKQIGIRADSLYKRILAGENFNQLATAFSNDYISAATGGNIPDVSVGQYDPAFENALWSLTKDGAVSKPVLTSHGWHILKRVSVKPVISDPEDKANLKDLEQKIMADNRWKTSGDYVYNQVITKVGVKKHSYNEAALRAYADSLLNMQPMRPEGRTIDGLTPMFSVGKLTYDVNAFIAYARTYRFRQDGSGAKPHNEARDDWEKYVMLNYYRDNLEDFNEEFRNQMAEFRDGNLFFEIMQQEVWNKAQADSTALLELYNKNKHSYVWKQSADVVIYFCTDQASANITYEAAKKKPNDWRNIIGMYSEKVMGDSARYEWSQIPNLGKTVPKAGMITTPEVNTADNTVSFAYIIKSYPQATQRTFNEARALVTNDYQEILEKEWDELLKKKYPVVVDEKVLQSISK
jgi:peptidyl-prolyl cis-trans isomerase SurA